jgi:predicted nuclease with TOPRIM domain
MPSIVELLKRLTRLEAMVAERDARIEALEAENAELRRRLG